MDHEIELTTSEALLTIEVLRNSYFTNPEDKDMAKRVIGKILRPVRDDLKENEKKHECKNCCER